MAWRVARSLLTLRDEINTKAPHRSKISDGTIGDAAHASRNSDHNPYIKDANGVGVVRAFDVTHDPAHGLNCTDLAEHVRLLGQRGDPRVRYVIWNRRIASSKAGWTWRHYSGSNAHDKHCHISVVEGTAYDSTAPWGWATTAPTTDTEDEMTLSQGASGGPVTVLQWRLQKLGYELEADGQYGPATAAAVKAFQEAHGFPNTGVYDWLTADRALDVLLAKGKA